MKNSENMAPTGQAPTKTESGAGGAKAVCIDVILASASPRRRQLLEDAKLNFTVCDSQIDETLEADVLKNPPEAAKALAERKAGAVVQKLLAQDYVGMAAVIGADTMVVYDGKIFGKPASLSDAKHMLRLLSGATHEVFTAVSVWLLQAPKSDQVSLGYRSFIDSTKVTFRDLTDDEIADYLRRGESFDKAGAYAIQGSGADLVARIEGDINTVIGLPVERLLQEFPDLGAQQQPSAGVQQQTNTGAQVSAGAQQQPSAGAQPDVGEQANAGAQQQPSAGEQQQPNTGA